MAHDTSGKFDGLTGLYFAGRRAHRDRRCQQCKVELITGEPVFAMHASFLAQVNHKYSVGAYCVPCFVAKAEEMKEKLAEASAWLNAMSKEMEPYFVAKALGVEKERTKLRSILRKFIPKELCPSCFHVRPEHQQASREDYEYRGNTRYKFTRLYWKCGHSDAEPSEGGEGTQMCCGCGYGPKIEQPPKPAELMVPK